VKLCAFYVEILNNGFYVQILNNHTDVVHIAYSFHILYFVLCGVNFVYLPFLAHVLDTGIASFLLCVSCSYKMAAA
jgi:hypothetical protein